VEFKENVQQATLEKLDGVKQVQKAGDRVWLITSVADRDMRQEIFNWAVAQQLTVLSLQKKERSLEQIFQDFTNKA
jgi:ABC-2 type transport system ATP-binding protein